MFARVSTFEGSPDVEGTTRNVREQVLPAARQLPGFKGMIALADRTTGKGVSITFWESEDALRASEDAADRIREGSAQATGDRIVSVERFEVVVDERS